MPDAAEAVLVAVLSGRCEVMAAAVVDVATSRSASKAAAGCSVVVGDRAVGEKEEDDCTGAATVCRAACETG
jgi:hypothetical protein